MMKPLVTKKSVSNLGDVKKASTAQKSKEKKADSDAEEPEKNPFQKKSSKSLNEVYSKKSVE